MKDPQPETLRISRWPVLVTGICGMLCAVLGLVVLTGWHMGSPALIRLRPNLVQMQYLTSAWFLLCGVGLSATAFGFHRFVTAVCGGVAATGGLLICLEYLFQGRWVSSAVLSWLPVVPGVSVGRPAAPAAIAFAFCGINLLLLGLRVPQTVRRVCTWIFGSSTLSLALVALSGTLLGFAGASVTGTFLGMSLHAMAGLSVLSLGLLATQFRDRVRLIGDGWLPVPLAFGIMAASLMLWQALTRDHTRAVRRQAEHVAANLAADSRSRLRQAMRLLELMKLRWEQRGGTPLPEWQADARASMRDEPIFAGMGRIDSAGNIERLEPEAGRDEAWARLAGEDGERGVRDAAGALKEASVSRKTVISPTMDLDGAERGFAVYFPMFSGSGFDGFLFGVLRTPVMAGGPLPAPAGRAGQVFLYENGVLISGPADSARPGSGVSAESRFDFEDHHWRFVVEPDAGSVPGSDLPRLVLLLGAMLSVAQAAAVLSFQHFRGRSSKIRLANQQLRKVERELRETLLEKNAARTLLETAGRMARLGHWELPAGPGDPQWSAVMYEIHGLSPDTPITRAGVEKFVHPEDRELIRERARKAMQTGEVYELEVRLITAKDRPIWIQMRGQPMRGENGEIVAIHGIVQDIDERHRAAEQLREQNRQLEIATDRAEANARAKAEFLANMSHEIRTPLNAVIGMSELLMDGDLNEREREFVETIHSSGDMLLSLINDILDFSKIESGQLELETIPVDLRDAAESVLDLLAGSAARKKLDLMCWIDPEVPAAVWGDSVRLRQVLMNLVGNAIKFTARGEVFLRLSATDRRDGSGLWLQVAVRDTGIGISGEGRKRLFGAFSQVDASTTRRFGGTGLGLAISQRLIRAMGGDIGVQSEEGRGSTFEFAIPVRSAPLPGASAKSSQAAAEPMLPADGVRVLIVEDNAAHGGVLKNHCGSWSMTPVLAGSSAEAIALLEAGEKFDLVIVDGQLPDVDGYALTQWLRGYPGTRELPVVILTAVDGLGVDWKSLEVAAVLTKPVKRAALRNAVKNTLPDAGHPASCRTSAAPLLPASSPPGEIPGIAKPLRILVAEDNAVNQRVVALHLQRMGYSHTMTANGEQALEAVAAEPFDVILLDVQMPVMDGLETARELCRRYPADQRPWIIALTANAQGSDREECLEAGMNDFLSKPVRGESLKTALLNAFEHRPSGLGTAA